MVEACSDISRYMYVCMYVFLHVVKFFINKYFIWRNVVMAVNNGTVQMLKKPAMFCEALLSQYSNKWHTQSEKYFTINCHLGRKNRPFQSWFHSDVSWHGANWLSFQVCRRVKFEIPLQQIAKIWSFWLWFSYFPHSI